MRRNTSKQLVSVMENTKENSNMGKDALEELGFSKSHDNKSDVWKKGKKEKELLQETKRANGSLC